MLKNASVGRQEQLLERCSRARLISYPVVVGGRRAAACATFFALRPGVPHEAYALFSTSSCLSLEFAQEFGSKWPPKAVKIEDDEEALLLAYYDYPAEHRRHPRTTNPIESPFRVAFCDGEGQDGHHERTGKSGGSGVAMIFELLEAAEGRWRRLNGYRLVPLVRAGARFVNGKLVERNQEKEAA